MAKDGFTTIRVPNDLYEFMKVFLKNHPEFSGKTDLTRNAIRDYIKDYNQSRKGKQ